MSVATDHAHDLLTSLTAHEKRLIRAAHHEGAATVRRRLNGLPGLPEQAVLELALHTPCDLEFRGRPEGLAVLGDDGSFVTTVGPAAWSRVAERIAERAAREGA